MSVNNTTICEMADELTIDVATLTGAYDLIGAFEFQPILVIFDNQSGDRDIGISGNGTSTWRTFPAGEALVLDLRTNRGVAESMTFVKGKKLYAIGDVDGTGSFSISYIYPLT